MHARAVRVGLVCVQAVLINCGWEVEQGDDQEAVTQRYGLAGDTGLYCLN